MSTKREEEDWTLVADDHAPRVAEYVASPSSGHMNKNETETTATTTTTATKHEYEKIFERRLGFMEAKFAGELRQQQERAQILETKLRALEMTYTTAIDAKEREGNEKMAAVVHNLECQLAGALEAKTSLREELEGVKTRWAKEKEAMESLHASQIDELKKMGEDEVKKEREKAQTIKGELAVLRQRADSLAQEAQAAQAQVHAKGEETKKCFAMIEGLQKDVVGLKCEVVAKTAGIRQQEELLRELKNENQRILDRCAELEKKATEAGGKCEERVAAAAAMASQVKALRDELKKEKGAKDALEIKITNGKYREAVSRKEVTKREADINVLQRHLNTVCKDIMQAVDLIQAPPSLLKEAVVRLYHHHVVSENVLRRKGTSNNNNDNNNKVELEALRTAVERLQKQLSNEKQISSSTKNRLLQENKRLLSELKYMLGETESENTPEHTGGDNDSDY